MRLKQIKLSGFKSFVDPTTFQVPSQLVGVVGPNGCGKSNVIDAVRWVLGESKASELRGESMQDVIFNGSSDRKASARASVELVFDNSLGRVGGNWAQYAEISVRRILSRDGQSVYQINNQTVRRRDVHDMFLGTGLGPRAYAIIGQGTISRLIEAKPEELRIYLEEAAGVSKYKERRRETESRLTATRENLSRVEDITLEMEGQIERLSRQAEVAAKFRQWDEQRTRVQHMQWIMRRDDARSARERSERAAGEATNALEAKTAELRQTEREIESLRQSVEAAGDEVHKTQAAYYERNAEVARLEGEIRRITEARQSATERHERLLAELASLTQRTQSIDAQLVSDSASRSRIEQETAEAQARVTERTEALQLAEATRQQAIDALDRARAGSTAHGHRRERVELESRRISQSLQSLEARLGRERSSLSALERVDAEELAALEARLSSLVDDEARAATQAEQAQQEWASTDAQRAPAQQALREAHDACSRVEARQKALLDLQERLDRHNALEPWLQQHELTEVAPLWERIKVDEGWEIAIEAVLRERVAARAVASLESVNRRLHEAPPAKVALFDAMMQADSEPMQPIDGFRSLASRARSGDATAQQALDGWLAGCYCADSVEQALQARDRLPGSCVFLTPQGHRVGRHEVMFYAPDGEHEGVLQRQQEIENLARDVRAKQLLRDEAEDHAGRLEAASRALATALEQRRGEHSHLSRTLADVRVQTQALKQRAERVQADESRLTTSVAELEREVNELTQRRVQLERESLEIQEQDAPLAQAMAEARQVSEQSEAGLREAREALRVGEHDLQAVRFRGESLATRIEQQGRELTELAARATQAGQERDGLVQRLAELDLSSLEQTLQSALAERSDAEQVLASARQRQSDVAAQLREADAQRLRIESEREPLMQRCTEMQLKAQAAELAIAQYQEQLDAAAVDEAAQEAVRASFEDKPALSWLQSEIARLAKAIDGLGPVNLAALDELEQARERKGFLDEQAADLHEAIATLEDAIQRIDQETRALLQETFDTVNSQFGSLFPELFGGGEARLELTGEEILDSGVQVMAHPPGKRNASIHLLSGGEKALTAIALVFSLFHLNPAPFCLLDEVDAPLDDANTERYRSMVQRMSEQTQFLFITHNKIAMEMAQQLIGVTMQERGVSRIVAVDLDGAAEMAEAA